MTSVDAFLCHLVSEPVAAPAESMQVSLSHAFAMLTVSLDSMAIYQMRLLIATVVRNFKLAVAPETTPKSMAPFEANGFRSKHDACHLIFTLRGTHEKEQGVTEFDFPN